MSNPYLDRLPGLSAHGRFDPKVPDLLREVSLDRSEKVLASVKCNHGQGNIGHLAITTHRIRWFQRMLRKGHDHWPLTTRMELERSVPPIIVVGRSELFQGRGFTPGQYRDFVTLHQQLVEALDWDLEHGR